MPWGLRPRPFLAPRPSRLSRAPLPFPLRPPFPPDRSAGVSWKTWGPSSPGSPWSPLGTQALASPGDTCEPSFPSLSAFPSFHAFPSWTPLPPRGLVTLVPRLAFIAFLLALALSRRTPAGPGSPRGTIKPIGSLSTGTPLSPRGPLGPVGPARTTLALRQPSTRDTVFRPPSREAAKTACEKISERFAERMRDRGLEPNWLRSDTNTDTDMHTYTHTQTLS